MKLNFREAQSGMYDMILHVGDFAYDMDTVSSKLSKLHKKSLYQYILMCNSSENYQCCYFLLIVLRIMRGWVMNLCGKFNQLLLIRHT